eukprot:EG_transcript_26267
MGSAEDVAVLVREEAVVRGFLATEEQETFGSLAGQGALGQAHLLSEEWQKLVDDLLHHEELGRHYIREAAHTGLRAAVAPMWAALRGRARQQLSTAEATGREDIVAEERGWRAGVRDRLESHCPRRIRFVAELHGLLSFEWRKLRSIRHEIVVRYGCSFREVQHTVDEACRREVAMAVPAPADSGAKAPPAAAPKWGTRSALWIAPWPAVVLERPRTAKSPKGSTIWHLLT